MSAIDKIRSLAETRTCDHEVVSEGLTYGDCRELWSELGLLSTIAPRLGYRPDIMAVEIQTLRRAIIAYVTAKGPCEGAEDGEGYCQDDACLYCQLARTVDEGRRR